MRKKILITSALPYVNNIPHLGNIIGCVLSADVFARYARHKGEEVFYVCATDEYGTATETKALEEKKTPQEICDEFYAIHRDVYQNFQISFDYFGRTTYPEHTQVTQETFKQIDDCGYILEQASEQLFCSADQLFLADRFILGTCPHCNHADAKGDQCEKCSKLLQPSELKNPRCLLCGQTPTLKKTKHLYLDLPKLSQKLTQFFERSCQQGFWPDNAKAITKSWLTQGLNPRPITRDLHWGVPVPKKGFENKVFYVWFDAVLGYVSNLKRALPQQWQDWWQQPDQVELYQFMAKDNVPFHTVVLPAMMFGSGQNWTMLHHVASTEYLNYENAKFSKSRNLGVFGTDVENTGIDIDLWRFYLLVNRPEQADSNFLWDEFFFEVNANFIDNIGNLLHRVLTFVHSKFSATLAFQKTLGEPQDLSFQKNCRPLAQEYKDHMDKVRLRSGLKKVLEYSRLGNKYFQETTVWKLAKTDADKAAYVLAQLCYCLRDIACMLLPFMPTTANRMLKQLHLTAVDYDQLGCWPDAGQITLVDPPQILFPKLERETMEALKERFGSSAEKKALQAQFDKLQVLVGRIEQLTPHPHSTHLSVLTVDFGDFGRKSVVAGLKDRFVGEDFAKAFIGVQCLFVYNLKQVDFGGVASQAMLLMANKKKQYEVLTSQQPLGTVLLRRGQQANTAHPLPEIDFADFQQVKLVVKNRVLSFAGEELLVGGQNVLCDFVVNGKVV